MKSSKNIFFIGVFTLLLMALLTACAATPAKSPSAPSVEMKPDQSDPTLPQPAMSPITPVEVEIQKPVKLAEPIALPERGSVKSIVQKMEANPYALYWKEKNAYSYYIGGVLRAEYKVDGPLTVKADNSGIVCEFGADGLQAKTGSNPEANEICSKLMFTLDDELSD